MQTLHDEVVGRSQIVGAIHCKVDGTLIGANGAFLRMSSRASTDELGRWNELFADARLRDEPWQTELHRPDGHRCVVLVEIVARDDDGWTALVLDQTTKHVAEQGLLHAREVLEQRTGELFGAQVNMAAITEKLSLSESVAAAEVEALALRLANANRELDAFSYSVSHDLRTPLRTIDGFSRVLLDQYAGMLDDRGRDYLQRVRNATQRMAQLLDDLLKLARTTRSVMTPVTVDLTAGAEQIAAELQQQDPNRRVTWRIQPGLVARGDRALLRVALENLLGNSWKFTSRREDAVIEVGAFDDAGKRVFFVKDNGAGFDMQYADQLFGVFQRLHSNSEFEGTGVGLATVQRIIHRHGGEIWADAALHQGATFYFTLGKP